MGKRCFIVSFCLAGRMQADPGSAEIQLPVGLSRRWDFPSAPQPGGEGAAQEGWGQCRGVHWGRCCFLCQKGNVAPSLCLWHLIHNGMTHVLSLIWVLGQPGGWCPHAGVSRADHLHTQVLLLSPWLRIFPINGISAFAAPSFSPVSLSNRVSNSQPFSW